MTIEERKMFFYALIKNYLYEKEQNKVWGREDSSAYSIAFGKLLGACTALDLDINETDEEVTVLTRCRKIVVINVKKQERHPQP